MHAYIHTEIHRYIYVYSGSEVKKLRDRAERLQKELDEAPSRLPARKGLRVRGLILCECARQQEHLSIPETPSRHLLCIAMHCSRDCHGCVADCAPIATQQCTCSKYSISGMNSDLDATVVAQARRYAQCWKSERERFF